MGHFFTVLVAVILLGPGLALSERPLKQLQVGEVVRSDEGIAIGPRAIQLPQSSWHLIALRQRENRVIGGSSTTEVTSGVFAYVDGTRTLAVIYFSASESTLAVSQWTAYEDCATTPVRFLDRFGSAPNQPECHAVRLAKGFLGSGLTGIWIDAKQRLSEIGAGWSEKQLFSRYSRLPWGDSFQFWIYVNPRLFAPKGTTAALDTNDDIPQAFVDWSRKQVVQLRRLALKDIRTFIFNDLPKLEETAVANLPPTQARPIRTDAASVADLARFPCATESCVGVLKRYLDRPWPRALVVAKERAFANWSGEDPLARAMDTCKRQAEFPDSCKFYAVNNEIVWKP